MFMLRRITLVAIALAAATTIWASGLSTPKGSSNRVLIPGAISSEGGNGTHFKSDIRVTNLRDKAQKVLLSWLPSGVSGPGYVGTVELQPGETLASDDFVSEVMHSSGLGAILVEGRNESDDPDADARLYVSSRVWTPQPGTEGTSSQAFAPMPLADVFSENALIIGHRRNDQYRTNVGIVNLDGAAHTFHVSLAGENPTLIPEEYLVTVPGLSMVQIPTSGAPQNQLVIHIQQQVGEGEPRQTLWTAYASSVDNVSGDGWTSVSANRKSK